MYLAEGDCFDPGNYRGNVNHPRINFTAAQDKQHSPLGWIGCQQAPTTSLRPHRIEMRNFLPASADAIKPRPTAGKNGRWRPRNPAGVFRKAKLFFRGHRRFFISSPLQQAILPQPFDKPAQSLRHLHPRII